MHTMQFYNQWQYINSYLNKFMISTKLRKDSSTKSLMIQFSQGPLCPPLQKFYHNCKQEGILVRRDSLKQNQLNFYYVEDQKTIEMSNIKLIDVPDKFNFVFSILYLNSQWLQQEIQSKSPIKRTLLIREGLDSKFYHDFQFQNTHSQQQSLVYLCQLSASIINSRLQKDIDFYDKKTDDIKGNQTQTLRSRLWKNIFFQIPGLGRQKCIAITSKYTSYQGLLKDFQGPQQLKNLLVSRGVKEMKLGSVLANRIYKCLFSVNGEQSIYD